MAVAKFPRSKAGQWLRLRISAMRLLGKVLSFLFGPPASWTYTINKSDAPWFRCLVWEPNTEVKALFINFHGGGFSGGLPGEDAEFCSRLARDTACRVLSLQYRFAPEFPYPCALDDSIEGIQWARRTFGIDRVIVGGFSAGGTLALCAVQTLMRRGLSESILGVIGFYPVMDFSSASESTITEKNPWKRDVFHEAYLLNVPHEEDLCNPLLSPVYAKATDLPLSVTLVVPEIDPNGKDMIKFCDRLSQEKRLKQRINMVRAMAGSFHGWNVLPDWLIGKDRASVKHETYATVVKEVASLLQ